MTTMNLAFRLRAGIRHDAETDSFVAFCPALDLYSGGMSEAEAEQAIRSAVILYLETCWERGLFEQALKRHDFHAVKNNPAELQEARSAEFVAIRESAFDTIVDFDVPLQFVGGDDHARTEADTSSCP